MKKSYIGIALLAIMLLTIGCAPDKPIPAEAIDEIYALTEQELANEYLEIKQVQDREDYCYIMVYVTSDSEEAMSLEDAYLQAEISTRSVVESAVRILNEHDINDDVSVWAQLPKDDGTVTVLGHTRYDAKSGSYEDFERYQP